VDPAPKAKYRQAKAFGSGTRVSRKGEKKKTMTCRPPHVVQSRKWGDSMAGITKGVSEERRATSTRVLERHGTASGGEKIIKIKSCQGEKRKKGSKRRQANKRDPRRRQPRTFEKKKPLPPTPQNAKPLAGSGVYPARKTEGKEKGGGRSREVSREEVAPPDQKEGWPMATLLREEE